ncbi:MAG: hypothetical protein ACKO55_03900, partial [Bacteroidota bacterium]
MQIIILIILLCDNNLVLAQEGVFPLNNNPTLLNFYRQPIINTQASIQRSVDTLALPFGDDFSYSGYFPDPQRWADRHVFR